jgi:hypothetical protein
VEYKAKFKYCPTAHKTQFFLDSERQGDELILIALEMDFYGLFASFMTWASLQALDVF